MDAALVSGFMYDINRVVGSFVCGSMTEKEVWYEIEHSYWHYYELIDDIVLCRLYENTFKEAIGLLLTGHEVKKMDVLDNLWFRICIGHTNYKTPLYYLDRLTYMDAVQELTRPRLMSSGPIVYPQSLRTNGHGLVECIMCAFYVSTLCSDEIMDDYNTTALVNGLCESYFYSRTMYNELFSIFAESVKSLGLVDHLLARPFVNEVRYFSFYPNVDWDAVAIYVMQKMYEGGLNDGRFSCNSG